MREETAGLRLAPQRHKSASISGNEFSARSPVIDLTPDRLRAAGIVEGHFPTVTGNGENGIPVIASFTFSRACRSNLAKKFCRNVDLGRFHKRQPGITTAELVLCLCNALPYLPGQLECDKCPDHYGTIIPFPYKW